MSEDVIFAKASELMSDAREEWLREACGDDRGLRRRINKLLAAHDNPDSYLEPGPPATRTVEWLPVSESVGQTIGRYKLREQIGEGGMGIVFVAEQEQPVRRKVALKIIKPGMDTKDVVARFEAERQALALMDHPHVAKVLDAGSTDSGRPYFVMELVRGIPITAYCDQKKLTVRQRLELFVQVCRAIQHAHQKGIIHRDIKPSNVMITEHDGRPVPKVIDFGVAKATNQRLTERTIYTRFQQIIGTPMYMSPEQAELSGLDVDTRSDIFSLGVLLYELITGVPPFEKERFEKAAYDEMRRIIREEEPPKPSTRLTSLGETATAISQRRGTDPERLRRQIRGDLDWIVVKAIEKDRTRRYDTADGFAEDVEAYLSDDVVEARPPTTGYRVAKFFRRNKGLVLTNATVFAALCTALVIALWSLDVRNRSLDELNRKNAELADARNSAEKLADELSTALDNEKAERRRANELLVRHRDLLIEKILQQALIGEITQFDEFVSEAEAYQIPEDRVLTLRGAAYLHLGENLKAQEVLRQAITLDDANVSAHAMLSIAVMHAGNANEWSRSVGDVLTKQPRPEYQKFDELFLGYARFYDDFHQAAKELKDVLDRHPSWVVPRAFLAGAYMEIAYDEGDGDSARKALRAIEGPRAVAEDNPFVLMVSLFIYQAAIQLEIQHEEVADKAKETASQLDLYPEYALGSMVRAMYYDRINERPKALEAWGNVLDHGSGWLASRAMAEFYRDDHVERILTVQPRDPEAQIAQAYVLALEGREHEARQVFNGLSTVETTWYIRYRLLQLLLLMKDAEMARQLCQQWADSSTGADGQFNGRMSIEIVADSQFGSRFDDADPGSDERFAVDYLAALQKYSEDDIPAALKKLEACQITRRHGTNAHWARAFQTRWAEFVTTRAEENTGDGIDSNDFPEAR